MVPAFAEYAIPDRGMVPAFAENALMSDDGVIPAFAEDAPTSDEEVIPAFAEDALSSPLVGTLSKLSLKTNAPAKGVVLSRWHLKGAVGE